GASSVSTGTDDFFFFQAEDGIRDGHVTGVQTCALPISTNHFRQNSRTRVRLLAVRRPDVVPRRDNRLSKKSARIRRGSSQNPREIGRASCREKGKSGWLAQD